MKTTIFSTTIVLTGLSAGLFLAWSISVIPGTLRIAHLSYLETMQSINRAILNPYFFVIFFGSGLALTASSIYAFYDNKVVFTLLLIASISYCLGTIGVTSLGNVPLNNELDALSLSEINADRLSVFRAYYESTWNRYHSIRTFFSVLSFLLSTIALLIENKTF